MQGMTTALCQTVERDLLFINPKDQLIRKGDEETITKVLSTADYNDISKCDSVVIISNKNICKDLTLHFHFNC